ncbi:hypothetical protein [Exilibacterium tricleocarpae]|uniref:hypothetical protein n=1 Tax=Exilibacterium tricleocarpae TaxID=2591008 RepID=UPI0015D44ECB|nr:hypothetical protein [Exilibacterium tricleocarpae]
MILGQVSGLYTGCSYRAVRRRRRPHSVDWRFFHAFKRWQGMATKPFREAVNHAH